jgi:hypothetical protein
MVMAFLIEESTLLLNGRGDHRNSGADTLEITIVDRAVPSRSYSWATDVDVDRCKTTAANSAPNLSVDESAGQAPGMHHLGELHSASGAAFLD